MFTLWSTYIIYRQCSQKIRRQTVLYKISALRKVGKLCEVKVSVTMILTLDSSQIHEWQYLASVLGQDKL